MDGWWVDAVSCTWMEVVRARRLGLRGNGDPVVRETRDRCRREQQAARLASAMAVTWEVKVMVGAVR